MLGSTYLRFMGHMLSSYRLTPQKDALSLLTIAPFSSAHISLLNLQRNELLFGLLKLSE
jgi:hypothetical protein